MIFSQRMNFIDYFKFRKDSEKKDIISKVSIR